MMTSNEIRQRFIEFFESKGHREVPSAPMVIKDDPTLMFTNAGMNQFKDVFVGNADAKNKRVVNSQKCLRVSGKHNDLEEVGVDTYHHTMFEMLGNWSFGDYFKKEAIDWAWEFLTAELKLDKNRLYVTVFEGDKKDGTTLDEEAKSFWKEHIAEDRILLGNKKDNFWEMGASGPCGPCSEIHVDLRNDVDRDKVDGASLVNKDHPQVVEIWNLVFIQFNRLSNSDLEKLAAKHIDTGMGLERLVMAMQAVHSNYDTDLFTDTIKVIEKDTGIKYQFSYSKTDVAFRVIADHIRAVAFSICDGQLPSNTGAGYVIRRILRRAIRYGFSFLNYDRAFMFQLVSVLVEKLGGHFSELKKQQNLIEKVIKEEEQGFLKTLDKGIERFNQYDTKNGLVDGKFAFELYDTYGFPIDLTELLASEKNSKVDFSSFEKHLQEQKDRSRKATSLETGDWTVLKEGVTVFTGYDSLEEKASVLKYRSAKIKDKELFQIVLDKTPFYSEGGGQVGDKGVLLFDNGDKVVIKNTKKEEGLVLHYTEDKPSDFSGALTANVSVNSRKDSEKNHSATHLLHKALQDVLGDHVEQKGSLVNEKVLRFDFSHFQKLEQEELDLISKKINGQISKGYSLQEDRVSSIDDAKARGAVALFGEKYGDKVRVIQFGDSIELCGGTHVDNTSDIGRFIIKSEGSVAAGIRRIEAITGTEANKLLNKKLELLEKVEDLMGNPKDLAKTLEKLVSDNKLKEKQLAGLVKEKAKFVKEEIKAAVQQKDGVNVITKNINLGDAEAIKNIAFQLKEEMNPLFMVLTDVVNDKPNITVVVSEDLSKSKDLNAGKIIRELAKEIKGGGGGQAFYATAGGKDASGLSRVLELAGEII
jgi:alanyl-tRNA synthetase